MSRVNKTSAGSKVDYNDKNNPYNPVGLKLIFSSIVSQLRNTLIETSAATQDNLLKQIKEHVKNFGLEMQIELLKIAFENKKIQEIAFLFMTVKYKDALLYKDLLKDNLADLSQEQRIALFNHLIESSKHYTTFEASLLFNNIDNTYFSTPVNVVNCISKLVKLEISEHDIINLNFRDKMLNSLYLKVKEMADTNPTNLNLFIHLCNEENINNSFETNFFLEFICNVKDDKYAKELAELLILKFMCDDVQNKHAKIYSHVIKAKNSNELKEFVSIYFSNNNSYNKNFMEFFFRFKDIIKKTFNIDKIDDFSKHILSDSCSSHISFIFDMKKADEKGADKLMDFLNETKEKKLNLEKAAQAAKAFKRHF